MERMLVSEHASSGLMGIGCSVVPGGSRRRKLRAGAAAAATVRGGATQVTPCCLLDALLAVAGLQALRWPVPPTETTTFPGFPLYDGLPQ